MAAVRKKIKWFRLILIVIAAMALVASILIFGPNTGSLSQGEYFCIHTGWKYDDMIAALKKGNFIRSATTFDFVARQAGLPEHLHPGRYRIKDGTSNFDIIRTLRSGKQTPVKLVINKLRTVKELVSLMSMNLEADSASLWSLFRDNVYLSEFGLDTNTALCGIMPDSYEFYWNTTADKAFRKIEKNYARYWSEGRKQLAKNAGLTPVQAITLASIVEEETNKNEDKPNIASVYLNRLKKGMKLQADPTVKYAIGDFTIRRITNEMLQYQSPYNTYTNEGLPPGPICTPSLSSLDAVLNAPQTNYIFFCAKDDMSGYSVFAATSEEHEKNAAKYRAMLNKQGIH